MEDDYTVEFTTDYKIVKGKDVEELEKKVKEILSKKDNEWDIHEGVFFTPQGEACQVMTIIDEE